MYSLLPRLYYQIQKPQGSPKARIGDELEKSAVPLEANPAHVHTRDRSASVFAATTPIPVAPRV